MIAVIVGHEYLNLRNHYFVVELPHEMGLKSVPPPPSLGTLCLLVLVGLSWDLSDNSDALIWLSLVRYVLK